VENFHCVSHRFSGYRHFHFPQEYVLMGRLQTALCANREIDVPVRNVAFLNHPVRHYDGNLLMEEVKDPVLNAARRGAKLIDSIAQEVRLGRRSSWPSSRSRSSLTSTLSFAWAGSSLNQLTNGAEPFSSR
jgi:hypothetical protein